MSSSAGPRAASRTAASVPVRRPGSPSTAIGTVAVAGAGPIVTRVTSTSAADADDPVANPPPTGTVAQPIRRSRPPRAAGPPSSATTGPVHSVKATDGVEGCSGGRAAGGRGGGGRRGGGRARGRVAVDRRDRRALRRADRAAREREDGHDEHREGRRGPAAAAGDRVGAQRAGARMVGAPQRGTEGRMSARSKLTGRSSWS